MAKGTGMIKKLRSALHSKAKKTVHEYDKQRAYVEQLEKKITKLKNPKGKFCLSKKQVATKYYRVKKAIKQDEFGSYGTKSVKLNKEKQWESCDISFVRHPGNVSS